jgi:Flp pilus assembly protein TadD
VTVKKRRNNPRRSFQANDKQVALLEEGARLYNLRQFEQMRALLEPALRSAPDDPGLNSLMGQLALATDDHETALICFDKMLARFPDQIEIQAHRAMCLLKLGRRGEARSVLEKLNQLAPTNTVALKYLAVLSEEANEKDKAEAYLRTALELDPKEVEILCMLGKTLLESQREQEAVPYIKRAIKLRPVWATPFNLLGAIYRQRCRFKTALSFYRHAWHLDPNDLGSAVNYGVGLLETGRVHESIEQYRRYLAINPECDQARFNMATALLQIGRLEEGWEAYDARRKMHKLRDHELPYPDWQGEPLEEKNILVLAEQGIGDEIWAANMFDDLIARAKHCIFECEPRLVTLFKRSFPDATVVPRLAQAVVYPQERPADVKLLAMSLARWLRVRPEQFPGKVGYLKPDPERQKYWRWRIEQLGPGLKVGISWRSMNIAGTRNDSYTSLSQWADILSIQGVHFVNLQYGECLAEIEQAHSETGITIHNFRDIDLKDGFDDVAALIGVLDVVIAPDNTVGAMAGALNIPVLQFVPSKYWSCHGKDYHPWFPSAKLFFRPWDHAWNETLRSLANELRRRSRLADTASQRQGIDSEEERELLLQRVQRAGLFYLYGQVERAKNICLEILGARPGYLEALTLLGAAERKLGNLEAAEHALIEALRLDPLLADAQNMLGAVYLERNALDRAEHAFVEALEIRPGYPDALSNLGNVYAARGNTKAAIRYYQKAIDTLSGFIVARYNLASALELVGRYDEALVEYLTVVEADPAHADAWNNLGILYGKLGCREDSTEAYRKALSVRPEDSAIRINLAKQILRDGSEKGEAIELLTEAAKLRPEDGRLFNTLGVAYAIQEDFEKARDSFQKAVDMQPDLTEAYRNLGVALQKLGRLEDAREVLQRAILLASPDNGQPN